MLESNHFTFNGIHSKDKGVVIGSPNGGLYKESFLPTRKINEQKISGNPIPFFQSVDEETLSFPLSIYLEEWKHRNNARDIARWLYTDYYKPLTFDSNPDLIFYAMFTNKSELSHNGIQDGYVTLNVQTKSPYMYSQNHEVDYIVSDSLDINIYNNGDLPLYITAELQKVGNGTVSILNKDSNEEFIIRELLDGEIVYLDFKYESAISSLEERLRRYLGDNTNDGWFSIPEESTADILITGTCNIKIKYQYAYLMFDKELGR